MKDAPEIREQTPTAIYHKGRGAVTNPANRYSSQHIEREPDDGDDPQSNPATELFIDRAKSIIATNKSPDIPFIQSINPYKGCEHGCIYCFARPSHAYWDLSPGLDFETKIFYKPDGPRLLEEALTKRNYQCTPIAFGTNTDPYQPIDKKLGLTRQLLEVLQKYRHPFTLVTKGSHLERDMDIFADMTADNLCSVMISLTTADNALKRLMEPRATSFETRIKHIEKLSALNVPVGVLCAPIIPMINDSELESMLLAAKNAGATTANYVFLRLPLEVKDMFTSWLQTHFPERAEHVLNLVRASRDGKLNHSEFGKRMSGEGVFAELIKQRFKNCVRKVGLNQREHTKLNTSLFTELQQQRLNPQMGLF